MHRSILGAALTALLLASASAQSEPAKVSVPFFGNLKCPITGKDVDRSLSVAFGAERVWVCCQDCIPKVKEGGTAVLAKAYPADKVVDLKNPRCPIRGEPAKADVAVVFQGRKVHFCCPGCDESFNKEPNKRLALLTIEGLKDAGNKNCPIMSGEKVVPDSFLVYRKDLINLCCPECVEDFSKDPAKYLKELNLPAAGPPAKPGHDHGGHGGHQGHGDTGGSPASPPAKKAGGCCGGNGHSG